MVVGVRIAAVAFAQALMGDRPATGRRAEVNDPGIAAASAGEGDQIVHPGDVGFPAEGISDE